MEIDYSILEDGFKVDHSHWTDYWHALSKKCNEDGDYQYCLHENKTGANELCEFLNQLMLDNKRLYDKKMKYKSKLTKVLLSIRENAEKLDENI